MNNSKKEVIAITGASGLIGSVIVRSLLLSGKYCLLVLTSDKKKMVSLAAEYSDCLFIKECDFTKLDSLTDVLSDIEHSDFCVKGLVHLGVVRDAQLQLDSYQDVFESSIITNVVSTFMLWDFFSKHMSIHGGGSLIYISSIYGSRAPDFSIYKGTNMGTEPDYAVTKSGGMALSRYYASAFGKDNVRSNTIVLGGVENGQPREFIERYSARTSLKRMAKPEEVVGLCEFLLSDRSSYITGADIPLDGGLLSL